MPKKFTSEQKEAIKKQAIEFWESATRSQTTFFHNVNIWERANRVMLPEDLEAKYAARPDRAALAPPDIFININSLRASLKSLIFASKPYATLTKDGQPYLRDEEIRKAEQVLQSMLDVQNNGKGFPSEASKIIHQALYAGMSACFTNWKRKPERRPVLDENGQPVKGKDGYTQFQDVVVNEYAETVGIDIRRIRIDPAADKRENIRIVGYQAIAKLSDMIKLNRTPDSGFDFDEQKLTRSSFSRAKYYEYLKEENANNPQADDQDFSDKNLEAWHIRGLFRVDNPNGSIDFHDLIVTIANRDMLLQIEENTLPIAGWELFDFPAIDQELSRLFTMGVVEPIFDTWIEKFIKRNQSLDESNRRTYQKYIGDKSACADLDGNIENEDGTIMEIDLGSSQAVRVQDVLAPLPEPGTGHDTFMQAEQLTGDMQKGMRVNDYAAGFNPNRAESATGVAALVAGGGSQLSDMGEHLRDTFLAPAWRKQLILWQYFKGEQENNVIDSQGQPLNIGIGELQSYYTVDIDIATAQDRPEMMRRMVEAYPTISNDPMYDSWLVRDTFNRILKLPNADKILVPDQHVQMIIERENIALAAGVFQQVSPFDRHGKHMELHMAFLEQAQPEGDIVDDEVFQQHLQEHQTFIEQSQQGLGNTKELGGNSGQQITPALGAIKAKSSSGVGLKQAGRQ